MSDKAHFSTIRDSFRTSFSLNDLSYRDQVKLFQSLSDKLGITNRLINSGERSAYACRIIDEQCDYFWNLKDSNIGAQR